MGGRARSSRPRRNTPAVRPHGTRACAAGARLPAALPARGWPLPGPPRPRLARQRPALRTAVARRRHPRRARLAHRVAPRRAALQRLADRARAGLAPLCRRAARRLAHDRAQPCLPGRVRPRPRPQARLAGGQPGHRRRRVLRPPFLSQGRPLLCRPPQHGKPHLRARNPHRRARLRHAGRARKARRRTQRHPQRH
jgi:hypothetical protein